MRTMVFAAAFLALAGATTASAQPGPGDVASALEKKWQSLKKGAASEERNVRFESIEAGRANGDSYPFRVTATVHDYESGYPPNGYYGKTCTMRFSEEVYTMRPDAFGGWEVQGRMTVFDEHRCENNTSAGAKSIPLASVAGQPAAAFGTSGAVQPLRPEDRQITQGEWACTGYGQATLFGFVMAADGTYQQGDEAGTYTYDRGAAVISFDSGPLGGQRGTGMDGNGFKLSDTVSCQAWN